MADTDPRLQRTERLLAFRGDVLRQSVVDPARFSRYGGDPNVLYAEIEKQFEAAARELGGVPTDQRTDEKRREIRDRYTVRAVLGVGSIYVKKEDAHLRGEVVTSPPESPQEYLDRLGGKGPAATPSGSTPGHIQPSAPDAAGKKPKSGGWFGRKPPYTPIEDVFDRRGSGDKTPQSGIVGDGGFVTAKPARRSVVRYVSEGLYDMRRGAGRVRAGLEYYLSRKSRTPSSGPVSEVPQAPLPHPEVSLAEPPQASTPSVPLPFFLPPPPPRVPIAEPPHAPPPAPAETEKKSPSVDDLLRDGW